MPPTVLSPGNTEWQEGGKRKVALNGYVILDAFFSLLALGAAVIAVALAASTLFHLRLDPASNATWMEDRVYLAIQLTYAVLGLTLASWATLYLVLDDFVPLWPGAMCIYGVTQIGEGNPGVTGWLPTLVLLAQVAKPLVAFAAGAALALYRIYRQAGASQLLPRVLGALLVVALLGTAASATELAYLSIPKRDIPAESGCCSAAAVSREGLSPASLQPEWLTPAYYACHVLMVSLLWPCVRRRAERTANRVFDMRLLATLAAAATTLVVAGWFAIDVAAPALLHLPYHHCAYDLVADVPESGVALGLLLWGTFCVGWSCVAGWLGRSASTAGLAATEASHWQSWAVVAYLGSAAMLSVELWLA